MADQTPTDGTGEAPVDAPAESAAVSEPAEQPDGEQAEAPVEAPKKKAPAKKKAAKRAPRKTTTKKAAAKTAKTAATADTVEPAEADPTTAPAPEPVEEPTGERSSAERGAAGDLPEPSAEEAASEPPAAPGTMLLFQPPDPDAAAPRKRRRKAAPKKAADAEQLPLADPADVDEDTDVAAASDEAVDPQVTEVTEATEATVEAPEGDPTQDTPAAEEETDAADTGEADDSEAGDTEAGDPDEAATRRRRRRGGRRRRKSGEGGDADTDGDPAAEEPAEPAEERTGGQQGGRGGQGGGQGGEAAGEGTSRRRRRRRREGDDGNGSGDDPDQTVTRVRKQRSAEDEITAVAGSTRLEAKKQRRREGREAGRRRAPIVSEAEFLARRESVDRVMVVRQRDDLTQIAVLEDKVLVEHYVARESQTSMIGSIYLGRVQNVLPSMEAAFIDIGKGRNAVLYAGEVNWSALGHKDGTPRKIESVLSSGQSVLVQVTKDPVGHKGARLTSQISLAGRFLVYVPDGTNSGISRKLPDTERNRLKTLLKEIVPESAGVIVRTAAEGASEDELTRDVERLKARWEDIEGKSKGGAPKLLYSEPDLTLKVVRDLFTEDFTKLVVQGDDAWTTVSDYVGHVAPDLEQRLERHDGAAGDVFAAYRIDEQIAKGLDRKVWLPSGGSLIIDRTEAMTVIDVNTGKFTGSGGNLEETVTKNNLEAAEEVVRQLRLRDIGGIIVVDFIDMVLESNRDLVLRRLVECLGRDRTRHQVAEVTSLGLVQMTRKRIGTGLLEAFSEPCSHCQGRGLVVHDMPVEPAKGGGDDERGRGRRRGAKGRGRDDAPAPVVKTAPSPADIAAMAKPPAPAADGTEPDAQPDTEPGTEPVAAPDAQAPAASMSEEPQPAPVADQEVVAAPVADQDEQPAPLTDQQREPAPDAPAPAAAAEDAPTPTAEPAAGSTTKVVTRTRRKASRPAGTPPTAEPPQPITVPSQPDEAPSADRPEEAAAATPAAPPKVVTRSRSRSATRAAGPPEPTADDGDTGSVEHVPVKRKGARKR